MQKLNLKTKYIGTLPSSGGGGSSDSSAIFVGIVTNGSSFPTVRPDGSSLVNGDYVKPDSNSTFPFTISGVTFRSSKDRAIYNLGNNSWYLDPGSLQDTSETPVDNPGLESLDPDQAKTQQDINIQFVNSIRGKRFDFTDSKVWNISHLLDRKPIVKCFDSNNREIFGAISYPTDNNAQVDFGINTTGYAMVY